MGIDIVHYLHYNKQCKGVNDMILKLDFSSEVPIYQQLRNQIVLGIAEGKLPPGERLPTIRALADEAGINMMTVSKAYQLLKQEGYILTDRRNGATVAGVRKDTWNRSAEEALRLLASEARLGGVGREEFLKLCGRLYDAQEG